MANYRGTRWRGQIPIPPQAHPLVRRLIAILNDEKTTLSEASGGSGVAAKTISDWRYRSSPNLSNFEAVLNAVGYELCIRQQKATHEQNSKGMDRDAPRPANPTTG